MHGKKFLFYLKHIDTKSMLSSLQLSNKYEAKTHCSDFLRKPFPHFLCEAYVKLPMHVVFNENKTMLPKQTNYKNINFPANLVSATIPSMNRNHSCTRQQTMAFKITFYSHISDQSYRRNKISLSYISTFASSALKCIKGASNRREQKQTQNNWEYYIRNIFYILCQ